MKKGSFLVTLMALLTTNCVSYQESSDAAQIRLELGWYFLMEGNLSAAKRNLLRARDAAKKDYRVNLALARLYQYEGFPVKSDKEYQIALKRAPNNGYVISNYATFLCLTGKYNDAQSYFAKTLVSNSMMIRADAFELAGYCDLQQKHYQQAAIRLAQALALDKQKEKMMSLQAQQYENKGYHQEAQLIRNVFR